MWMRSVLRITAAVALLGSPRLLPAQTIQPCADPSGCAQLMVGDGGTVPVGGSFAVPLTFKQGPDNGQAGGSDETAALALTLSLAGNTGGTPLGLATCGLACAGGTNAGNACATDSECTGGYCLAAAVVPDASISNFKVVVENVTCTPARQHCLCPDSGSDTRPDNFMNLVIYGPNPLPTPGPNPIDIPILPAGPQQLLTINLKANGGASGTIPLHVYNQGQDSSRPQFTAFMSVGDRLAIDETCSPLAVPGTPPCSASGSVSQVALTDGTVTITGACVGDCNNSKSVTVDELLTMVSIALGNADVSACIPGDPNNDLQVTIDEVLTAVSNAVNGCS